MVDTTNATPGVGEIVLSERITILHRNLQEDVSHDFYNGPHTVNNEHELIYIDRNYDIIKLSRNMKTSTILIERTEYDWESRCVYFFCKIYCTRLLRYFEFGTVMLDQSYGFCCSDEQCGPGPLVFCFCNNTYAW